MIKEELFRQLNWRYAVKKFDITKKHLEFNDLKTILEAGRLAPSCYGIEPWKFLIIENSDLRKRIREVGYDQEKITDSDYLVVLCQRTDRPEKIVEQLISRTAKTQSVSTESLEGLQGMVMGTLAAKNETEFEAFLSNQCYIALGFILETAALFGIDAGPMEGFSRAGVDEILNLESKGLKSLALIAFGKRSNQDKFADLKKVRRDYQDLVELI